MYYIGFDIGSSSIKAALVDVNTGKEVAVVHEPEGEMDIIAVQSGWAEQDPESWWNNVCRASQRILKENNIHADQVKGIGISYQMHGLVLLDREGDLIRNAIIWCDSRAVAIGNRAFETLGPDTCMAHLLNSPANFTLSKLKWVKDHEPHHYDRVFKFMLPGDYIAYRFSGAINTTVPGLSEGILWDFKSQDIPIWLLDHYEIDMQLIPEIVPTFGEQSKLSEKGAEESGLKIGTPILYRAGDQPNNALSLHVLEPGEVAATGGTSGVIYAVTDTLSSQEGVKINNFAHVNHSNSANRIGKLLCINGTGIQYRWVKQHMNPEQYSYQTMNTKATQAPVGSENLQCIPFGNGAERMFNNTSPGAHFCHIDFNKHRSEHIFRATLEGIAFSFVYGMDILKKDHTKIHCVRAGNDNLFQAQVFSETIATLINKEIEIYNTTGAVGAARAAGFGAGVFDDFKSLMRENDHVMTYTPLQDQDAHIEAYIYWKKALNQIVKNNI